MDELLQRLIERQAALRTELEAVDKLVATYHRPLETAPLIPEHGDLFAVAHKRSRAGQAKAVHAMMEDAERIIRREGRPLSRSFLARRLSENGHVLEGADKNKVLGTNLWRSGRFRNIPGHGYWPHSLPLPDDGKSD